MWVFPGSAYMLVHFQEGIERWTQVPSGQFSAITLFALPGHQANSSCS